ncbi:hypothetical protein [Actinokineospora inagensis]|uniref:hypothetical protein n=1 Tax=Actinokineospora inagensis TaxID=103730 RepID=UPI0004020F72|nr:hypothetical protein [Actinokineospora inagensis]
MSRLLSRLLPTSVALVAAAALATPAHAALTPTLTASFSVGASAINATRNLVLVAHNSDAPTIFSYGFTATIPAGLTPAGAPSTDCGGTTVSTTPLGRSAFGPAPNNVYVEGSMYLGLNTCTITVPVTATTEGTSSLCPAGIADLSGLTNFASCVSIYFEAPHPSRAG